MVSHDRDLLNDVCDHIVHIDQREAGPLHRQLRPLRAHARRAAGQRCRPAGQDRGPAQAHAGLRRPLQGQGQQGAPGAVAHQDAGEARTDRQRADRGDAIAFNFPPPEQLASPIDDAGRGLRRLCRRTAGAARASTCASTWKTASRCSARTATASRPSSACLAPAAAARGPAEAARRSCASATSRRTRRKSSTSRRRRSIT